MDAAAEGSPSAAEMERYGSFGLSIFLPGYDEKLLERHIVMESLDNINIGILKDSLH